MATLPKVMTAMVLTGYGGFDRLDLRHDVPVPDVQPGEVLIKVAAAGVNNTDINTRIGWYSKSVTDGTTTDGASGGMEEAGCDDATWAGGSLRFPHIQGADVCGRIVAAGEGVSGSRIGERVIVEPCWSVTDADNVSRICYFGSECPGGFAQYVAVPAANAWPIESDLTDTELASFPCSYSTAMNLIMRLDLKAGETVLVTGASGGVGSAAVQIAAARGAQVIAIAGAKKAADVAAIGAGSVLDRGADPVAELGADAVDCVIDLVAGPGFGSLLDVLRPGGRYATSGAIAGPIVSLDVRTLYLKDLSLYGCTVLRNGVFKALVELIETGTIRPLVARAYRLADMVTAQQDFLAKAHVGKLVLEMPE